MNAPHLDPKIYALDLRPFAVYRGGELHAIVLGEARARLENADSYGPWVPDDRAGE